MIDWPVAFAGIKTILDPLAAAAWPISLLIAIMMLKPEIVRLVNRVKGVRALGVDADFVPVVPNDQLSVSSPVGSSESLPSDASFSKIPPPIDVYKGLEDHLIGQLNHLFLDDSSAKLAWATRAYARAEVERFHESNYRIIFQSQLFALNHLNQYGPVDEQNLVEFYEEGKATEAGAIILDKVNFTAWLGFLLTINYATRAVPDQNKLLITSLGRDFLSWLVNRGVSQSRLA